MMNARAIILLALVPAAVSITPIVFRESVPTQAPGTAVADSICPPELDGGRRKIVTLLTADNQEPFRVQIGITNTDTSSIRLLVDATDLDVCQHFIDTVKLPPPPGPERIWAFYEANGFYFIATRAARPGLALRMNPLIVLDSTLAVRIVLGT